MTTTITEAQVAELLEAAEKATRHYVNVRSLLAGNPNAIEEVQPFYILASPSTILSLLSERARLMEALEQERRKNYGNLLVGQST